MAIRFPIGWIIKPTIFAQFCGGETIAECAQTTKVLDARGIGTILDYSIEGKKEEDDFDTTANEILATIQLANQNPHIPFCVFKVTGICKFGLLEKVNNGDALNSEEQASWERILARVDRICAGARDAKTPVFIDAEESWIQEAIDRLAEEMIAKYNTEEAYVYNTVQLYRHDRLAYLKNLIAKAKEGNYYLGVKLVRGAYMEKERERAEDLSYPSPIQPDKSSSDEDFNLALKACMENLDHVRLVAGTHNETSSSHLAQLMEQYKLQPSDHRVYFAQLYGMSDHISFNLSHLGYNVAKYVPYGPIREVIPYLIRRAEENSSVKGQTGRELGLIMKEIKRRKRI
tara:strand:- start:74 stop:1105 length:1032 start_codon:yes stop_codon:yes gene_type:complete